MIWNLIGSIGGKVLDIVDDVVEENDEANRLKFEIQRQLIENKSSELEASAKIVLAEAQRSWRPTIGWVCALAFAYHFLVQPMIVFIASLSGHPIPLPDFDMSALMSVTMGLLGLGGLRTFEKMKGISK